MPDEQQKNDVNRLIRQKVDGLDTWILAFLRDGQARELSPFTTIFYKERLTLLVKFCKKQEVTEVSQITAPLIREFVLSLKESGHNEGGRHAAFRALRAFLYWWERETEPENWTNPLKKISIPNPKPPRLNPFPRWI